METRDAAIQMLSIFNVATVSELRGWTDAMLYEALELLKKQLKDFT